MQATRPRRATGEGVTVWRWLAVDGSPVLHLVTGSRSAAGAGERYDAACGRVVAVVVSVEPGGEMRCVGCMQRVLIDGR
jgi:hypothetical protein